jgi:hypothetical protein
VINLRLALLVICCLPLQACFSVDETYPVEVNPGIYVLLIAPLDTRLNPEVFGPASERAEAFCRQSGEHMIVVIQRPYTIVKDDEEMDIMYYSCMENPPHLYE